MLWCYLLWYLATVATHFDPTPSIWLNALGMSVVIGIALQLSVAPGVRAPPDAWRTVRLFMMPFCVSSYAALIKDRGYWVVVPPSLVDAAIAVGACAAFLLLVSIARRTLPHP